MNERKRLTEEEFAREVGLHPMTVGRLRREGKIRHRRAGRKVFYLAPEDVDAFFDSCARDPYAPRFSPLRRAG